MLFQMNVYVVRTYIRCGTNVYLGGTKRRWYEKPGIQITESVFSYCRSHFLVLKA